MCPALCCLTQMIRFHLHNRFGKRYGLSFFLLYGGGGRPRGDQQCPQGTCLVTRQEEERRANSRSGGFLRLLCHREFNLHELRFHSSEIGIIHPYCPGLLGTSHPCERPRGYPADILFSSPVPLSPASTLPWAWEEGGPHLLSLQEHSSLTQVQHRARHVASAR